ncbi:TonB-dependent receptor [Flavisphingomonas formosensis]|uniref:TonB-dependent receptor n=1 Tax=Flavisphingomonas formosensis TaxID=861534 RepID=UPI0012FACEA3
MAAKEALLHVPGYALLDLRAGIESADTKWRFELWGRNVTDKFYNVGTTLLADYTVRFTGMPAAYGAALHYRL